MYNRGVSTNDVTFGRSCQYRRQAGRIHVADHVGGRQHQQPGHESDFTVVRRDDHGCTRILRKIS